MNKYLYRWEVQANGGGARDQVEEGRHLAAKRGRPNRVHGNKCNVVTGVADDALYEGSFQSSVDAVSDGNGRGRKGRAVAFDK